MVSIQLNINIDPKLLKQVIQIPFLKHFQAKKTILMWENSCFKHV